ncbi:MAG: ABC transporter permease [Verrucomicrobia bacterium]|nr:ABC transporter permease [Verrucomicrobiota bacterium]
MNFGNAIAVGLREVWAHKFRSVLTMLGIILGVSSLIAMSALIKGMENGMKEALIALGGLDKVLVRDQDVPPAQAHLADQAVGKTIRDVYALRRSAPLIRVVSPEMGLDRVLITRGGKRTRPEEFVGAWPAVLEMNLHTVEHGRFFTDLDEDLANSVCVIGTGIRDRLFGDPDEIGREIVPIGEVININGLPFTIVGMFARYESESDRRERELAKNQPKEIQTNGVARSRGWNRGSRSSWAFSRKNRTVYIPLNTMWVKFRSASGSGQVPDPRLSDLDIKVANLDLLEKALQQARNVLMITHNGIEDFTFQTQEDSVENINETIRSARLSGGLISAISLIVGGIGIMNIMLASITERVREIGIRKSVGATTVAVFIQILVESSVVAMLGGLAGLVVSYGVVQLLMFLSPTGNLPVITAGAMATAFLFSVLVGMLAGLVPAYKASRLDPIQALRFE